MAIIENIDADKKPPEDPKLVKMRMSLANLVQLADRADADLRTRKWHREFDTDADGELPMRPALTDWDEEGVDLHELRRGPLGFKQLISKPAESPELKKMKEQHSKILDLLDKSEASLVERGANKADITGRRDGRAREQIAGQMRRYAG